MGVLLAGDVLQKRNPSATLFGEGFVHLFRLSVTVVECERLLHDAAFNCLGSRAGVPPSSGLQGHEDGGEKHKYCRQNQHHVIDRHRMLLARHIGVGSSVVFEVCYRFSEMCSKIPAELVK